MKMFNTILAMFICTVLLTMSNICAASIYDYPTLAVIPFTKKAAVSADITLDDASIASDTVNEELINSDRFDVVDRANLQDTLDEISLGMTGLVSPESAAQAGNLLGAQYLVVGSINGLSTVKKSGEVAGFGTNSVNVIAHVSARIIEVETGRTVLAGSGRGTSKVTLTKAPLRLIRIGTVEVSQEQIYDAIQKASVALVDKMMSNMDKR